MLVEFRNFFGVLLILSLGWIWICLLILYVQFLRAKKWQDLMVWEWRDLLAWASIEKRMNFTNEMFQSPKLAKERKLVSYSLFLLVIILMIWGALTMAVTVAG
ncbi:hypothetical protein ROA7450_01779 [Roseovarius albus]|uniref:Uncharacterized protein n=1 Tax=Roseovarius albus TaxID=1247867 RepID=A0A1X6Z0F5_9RHOB|nr:hypothetical protein ROA7450_01779 [Roseovarius albus]